MDLQTRTIITTQFTDRELISDEHQTELIGLANADRLISFRVGDIAIEEIMDKAKRGIAVSHDRIDEAVGRYCGKKLRTVRYYRETAAFYDQEVRNRYDMLPFSFFVFARTMGERWHEVLEFAMEHPQFKLEGLRIAFLGLRVASHNPQVASGFGGGISADETPEAGDETPETAVEPLEKREVSRTIPHSASSHANLTVVNNFAANIPQVIDIASRSKLPTAAKVSLITALKTLERLLPQLVSRMVQ